MSYGSVLVDTLNTSSGIFQTNNAYKGVAKAWVQFAGSGPTIAASFNISSITRIAAGEYTVNFATAMADANYAYTVLTSPNSGYANNPGAVVANAVNSTGTLVAPTTSSFTFTCFNLGASGYVDPLQCNVIVCGN